MALFHLSVTQTKRSAGQSAIASAAYRAGERLYSEYYGEYSDYTRKGGVICSDILLPSHAPPEYADRQTLKWAVTIKGQDWFYVKYVIGEPMNNQEGINSGVTLGFYDSNDTCLGYAQEQIVGDYGYLWIMLNPDFSPTGLWATEKGDALYDEADNPLATGKVDFSYSSDLCDFTIDCVGGQDVPVFAKFAMYMELYNQAKTLHG